MPRGFFGSLQVGVASPLGLEAAIHTISQYCERKAASTSKIVMTIDFPQRFQLTGQERVARGL